MITSKYFIWILLLTGTLIGCESSNQQNTTSSKTGEALEDDIFERGPYNGRLLSDGNFELELSIYETGVPPEFRAWVTNAGEPIDLGRVDLRVILTRLGNQVEEISFHPQGEFLRGTTTVYEPHSFIVSVEVSFDDKNYSWEYESLEGRTKIDPQMAEAFGITTIVAGPAVIEETVTVYGYIVPNKALVREVSARFDGEIQAVNVSLGEVLQKGDILATVESNESLQPYTINAPISGVVTELAAREDEQTVGRRLFTIIDTSSVWANLSIFPSDRSRIHVGAKVTITPAAGGHSIEGSISHVNVLAGANQAVTARTTLDNGDGLLVPGTYITAEITSAENNVPLAVKRSGLQSFRDFTVVFAQVGDEYEVRMLELGRLGGEWVEVLGGLDPGTVYVTENSYVIKADIEKSGASHDH
jgi:cobalt-zinc-cadmium efflux system membrane fusion protein